MKFLSSALVALLICLSTFPSSAAADEHSEFPYAFRCFKENKKKSLCRLFPHIFTKTSVCYPKPTVVGTMIWKSENNVTITDTETFGYHATFKARRVTYREVYDNGAWGDFFTRIYPKEKVSTASYHRGK